MRRIAVLFILLVLLASSALAEQPALTLRTATSAEEVARFLVLPPEDGIAGVEPGYIRYVAQAPERDPIAFRKEYWLGGEEGSMLDLTMKKRNGYDYGFHAGVMCTRAVYSMALSVLGIDMSPGAMSALTGERNLDEPYDMITEILGIERVERRTKVFNTMMDNYLNSDSYSPVYLFLRKPSGAYHALLVVGVIPESKRFLVVDSSPYELDGEPCRVYFISLNPARTKVVNSTFSTQLVGSEVLQLYQWKLPETAETP